MNGKKPDLDQPGPGVNPPRRSFKRGDMGITEMMAMNVGA